MNLACAVKRLALGMLLVCFSHLGAAQGYPSRPVRLVVPFPPGTGTDLTARIVSQQLQAALGQPFVVDNKPGAGGSIAAMDVIRSAPDGYTLIFASNSVLATNVALLKNIPYDPNKDFTPLAGVGKTSQALMVKPDFPAKTLPEFIAYAKQRPGKLSAGYGSSSAQISLALFARSAGLDILAIPYKGIPLAVNDVIGGTLDFTFADIGNSLSQAKGGKLRAIAVTAEKGTALAPDWPPVAAVIPGFEILGWVAVAGPPGLPPQVAEALGAALGKVVSSSDMKQKLATIGFDPMPMTPAGLKAFMLAETVKWSQLAKDAKVEPE